MRSIYILISILAISLVIMAYYCKSINSKTGYVELKKLYEEFELKKEYQLKLDNVEQSRKYILDSVKLVLTTQYNIIEKMPEGNKKDDALGKIEKLKEQYLEQQNTFAEDNERLTKQYEQQIWSQINQYINEYSKKNNYDYVYGADGSGSVMYANKDKEITNDVVEYINNRFKGISK